MRGLLVARGPGYARTGRCRVTNHPADNPRASWRCGDRTPGFTLGDLVMPEEICTLPAGHKGWHRADSGNQWKGDAA